MFAEIRCDFTDFRVELNVDVLFLSEHDCVLQVEMKQDNHLSIARLEECAFDVVVENVDLVSSGKVFFFIFFLLFFWDMTNKITSRTCI